MHIIFNYQEGIVCEVLVACSTEVVLMLLLEVTSFKNLSSELSWVNFKGIFAAPAVERDRLEALMFSFDICSGEERMDRFVHDPA